MKKPFLVVFAAAVLALSGCAEQPAHQASPKTRSVVAKAKSRPAPLLLISIDGYRYDYIDRHLSPTLEMLAGTGVRARSMQPSFPSLTFPNHYTIVTGLRPDQTGIVANSMRDAELGRFSLGNRRAVADGRWWNGAVPLWESADRQGLRTATMFWPGSEASIHGIRPDYWQPFDEHVTPDQRVDQVLAWLDLPPEQRPSFLTLYFDAVDHAGHTDGPDSKEVDDALRSTDEAMARLVTGLKQRGLFDQINIIVLSDHGMAPVAKNHHILIDSVMPLDKVTTVGLGVLAGFDPKPGFDFAPIEKRMQKQHLHMQCWDKTQIPKRFHYGSNPRVPKLVCLADVGWRITTRKNLARDRREHKSLQGDHGYDNIAPTMQALFVAQGPAFRRGASVDQFSNLDVYPLMAHLLGIKPQPNDGNYDAVKDMLTPDER